MVDDSKKYCLQAYNVNKGTTSYYRYDMDINGSVIADWIRYNVNTITLMNHEEAIEMCHYFANLPSFPGESQVYHTVELCLEVDVKFHDSINSLQYM